MLEAVVDKYLSDKEYYEGLLKEYGGYKRELEIQKSNNIYRYLLGVGLGSITTIIIYENFIE